ncbi:hypothetical protein F0562_019765 [Nyssa sinensis]|uniref:Uncharacterized protein n=1 Tax=Nyssa sinensis TaxID=561372 RepID=A0A5J5BQ91_9ASTE|nr:hypothetical protein F0562_019765 [Nyssa sinensis]
MEKVNGIWYGDKELVVKTGDYDRRKTRQWGPYEDSVSGEDRIGKSHQKRVLISWARVDIEDCSNSSASINQKSSSYMGQQKRIQKKKKTKSGKDTGGIIREMRFVGAVAGRKKKRRAIFKAAAVAISLSVMDDSKAIRDKRLLNEPQAIWAVSKALGLVFYGSENKELNTLVELGNEDESQCSREKKAKSV